MGIEQRRFPRFNVELTARVQRTTVSVKNISRSGLQAACPAMLFDFLAPALEAGTAELSLTITEEQVARARCKVVYVSEYGDEYLIGLEFAEFEEDGEAMVAGLIAERTQSEAR